jgi:cytochrome c553
MLASVCSGCHAADASAEALVNLQGYSAARIETLMLGYKNEPDGPSAMHRIARGYTDRQIGLIAEYLSGRLADQ